MTRSEHTPREIDVRDAGSPAEELHRQAVNAQAQAADAHRRSAAARDAADRAVTEYARIAHRRAAELHARLAVSHEDRARALRAREEDQPRD
jgi:hypothetical protein